MGPILLKFQFLFDVCVVFIFFQHRTKVFQGMNLFLMQAAFFPSDFHTFYERAFRVLPFQRSDLETTELLTWGSSSGGGEALACNLHCAKHHGVLVNN